MLQGIRERAQTWIMWVIVILIIVPFALWGVHQYFGPDPEVPVASVNGHDLSLREFQTSYQQQRMRLQSMLGASFDINRLDESALKQQTLQRMITEDVVVQAGVDRGLAIGDGQLAQIIRSLDVFKVNLAQGRNFSRDFSTDEDGILVNQALVDLMGWKEPVGRLIPRFFDEGNFQIIGVVENFHYSTFHTTIEPMALVYHPGSNICVRIRPGDPVKTVAALKNAFLSGSPGQPFDYYFLDDAFDRLYQKELRTGKIFGAFATLTVLVACLGLFSLAAFAVERRTKEIGIGPFLLAGTAALAIAFLTISWHTFRAASSNPVDTLRYE